MSKERSIFEVANKVVQPPINQREATIELNFDLDDPNAIATVSTNVWDFEGNGAQAILDQFDSGLTKGVGCGEGVPFKYSVQDDISKLTVLDAYLDLGSLETELECDRVRITSRVRGGVDWLGSSADQVRYSLLANSGFITTADAVSLPYIISSIPDREAIAILILAGFVILIQVLTIINDLGQIGADLAGILTTPAGIIKAILYAIFLAAIVVAIAKLLFDLVNVTLQPTKYHSGMKLLTLLQKGAEFLGMTFESTIFDNDPFWQSVIILPEKFKSERNTSSIFGFLRPKPADTQYYFRGSFGELLRRCKTIFNAKIVIVDDVIKLERVDTNTSIANYRLPDVEQRIFGHNFEEFKSSQIVEFTQDESESNTIDNYQGTLTTVTPKATIVQNPTMTLYGGEPIENKILFSRGTRKETLTKPEEILKLIGKPISLVVKALSRNVSPNVLKELNIQGFLDQFGDRIGMLSLENDYFTNAKMIGMDLRSTPAQNRVSKDNAIKINSEFLYDNFHFVDSGVPTLSRPNANQWIRRKTRVPFCKEDFELVKNNNLIFDTNDKVAKIESLKWNEYHKIADINYRVNELFLSSIEEEKDTPDGK